MEATNKARLFEEGGKVVASLLRVAISRPRKPSAETKEEPVEASKPDAPPRPSGILLPTAEETTTELKRRLARELYRAELDLAAGLKIAGKPCDCLSSKHTLMLEAASEELISQDPDNHVYQEIIAWIGDNRSKVSIEAIQSGVFAAEYPHMANEFKTFRKRVMGSVGTDNPPVDTFSLRLRGNLAKERGIQEQPLPPLSLEQAKKLAADEAAKEVERQWKEVPDGTK